MDKERNMLEVEDLDKLKYAISFIDGLLRAHDTHVLERQSINERIFLQLNNCTNLMKDIEKKFLDLLQNDARAIARAAINNPSVSEQATVLLEEIDQCLHEYKNSKLTENKKIDFLRRYADEGIGNIKNIKYSMEKDIQAEEEQRKRLLFEMSRRYAEGY